MPSEFEAELVLPGDPAFLSLLHAFVTDVAGRSLSAEQHSALLQAAELAFSTIVGDALTSQHEKIRITARSRPHALELSLVERGLPIDDAYARRDRRWNDLLSYVDEAHWIAHGAAGSELRLTFRTEDIAFAQGRLPPVPAGVPKAAPQEYTIRRFVPDDGPGVVRCFFEAWEYHYPVKAMYSPERIAALNASRELVSFVAAAEDGDVAGHYALRPFPDAPVAEGGAAAVRLAHRGRALAERMRIAAEGHAPALAFKALYFEPVTDHVLTQKMNEKLGAHPSAVSLAISPADLLQPGMELSATKQRQSLLLYVEPLCAPETRTVFLPAQHRTMIERLYAGLGIPIVAADAGPSDGASGAIRLSVNKAKHVGTIAIDRIGPQTIPAALQALDDLRGAQHLAAVYVRIPLSDPAAPEVCAAFERAGCFFSGIEPWVLGGADALRLQWIARPLDLSQLSILSPFCRELLDYVASAMPTIMR